MYETLSPEGFDHWWHQRQEGTPWRPCEVCDIHQSYQKMIKKMIPPEESSGETAKALLSSCVPQLKLLLEMVKRRIKEEQEFLKIIENFRKWKWKWKLKIYSLFWIDDITWILWLRPPPLTSPSPPAPPCKSSKIMTILLLAKVSQFWSSFKDRYTTSPSYLSLAEVYSHCTDEPDQINTIEWSQIKSIR